MLKLDGAVKVVSPTMPEDQIKQILGTPGVYHADGHFQYPVSEGGKVGNHLDSLFLLEPIVKNDQYIEWIVDDICRWIAAEKLEFDVIFAPAQMSVTFLVEKLASRLNARKAYWEYTYGGWFGAELVEGEVKKGDRVLVVNGVSMRGRCVGDRLPRYVENLGGTVVAAAVFAKGTAPGVADAEKRYGKNFYATVQVDIKVAAPQDCQQCAVEPTTELTPWTTLRDS
jgi:orotate phosphoribosyltransferase